jgi:hypothetical protein
MTKATEKLIRDEAANKLAMARKAEREGDTRLRDAFILQARDRYRAAGDGGMLALLDRWVAGV